jgi:hypothetical protein
MDLCFAFNAMVDQTYMPADKQEVNIELGLVPLVELLEAHPRIKAAWFFTGYTDQVLAQDHPDLVLRIKQGVAAGRYEIGTYTYTHPVLSLIPYEDVYRQVELGLKLDQEVWGLRPTGTILPEGSWDPSLAKVFADLGIEWALVSPAAYLADHPEAGPDELFHPVALQGTFGASVRALFISGLREGLWGVIEQKQTQEEYFGRLERAIAAGASIFVDKSDAEFLYLALPRLTDTPWGDGSRSQMEPYVRQTDALFSRLEEMRDLEFALVSNHLSAHPPQREIHMRPGQGWKDLSEWLRGSEKVACVTDEARQEIKTADLLLVLADRLGLDTRASRKQLEQAWDWLLRAETSIGRRACAHPDGQPSRIVAALEHAALARQAARQALDLLPPMRSPAAADRSQPEDREH